MPTGRRRSDPGVPSDQHSKKTACSVLWHRLCFHSFVTSARGQRKTLRFWLAVPCCQVMVEWNVPVSLHEARIWLELKAPVKTRHSHVQCDVQECLKKVSQTFRCSTRRRLNTSVLFTPPPQRSTLRALASPRGPSSLCAESTEPPADDAKRHPRWSMHLLSSAMCHHSLRRAETYEEGQRQRVTPADIMSIDFWVV